jgi:hydroxypyruvate reductase
LRPINLIIGDVRQAAQAALAKAAELGFSVQLLSAHLEGEAREVGRVAAAIAKDAPPGHCFVLAGETTVTVRGDGRGGRNQEGALAAAIALSGWPYTAIATFATDGEDGPTDAAGAVVSGSTAAWALAHDLDPVVFLARNDSYTFFKQLDKMSQGAGGQGGREDASYPHLIQTGSTGTNVNDLLLILTYYDNA